MFRSTKQRAASRANSQKSTGPRTTAGKAVSRFNALKHGIYAVHQIMFDEKPEDLAEFAAEYHEHHCPADSDQRFLVDTLVANEWRLRRTRRVEAELWQSAHDLFEERVARAHGLRTPQPAAEPAIRTIQTHFRVLSFGPSNSKTPHPRTGKRPAQLPDAAPFAQPDPGANAAAR
jgi:hypothetical protein